MVPGLMEGIASVLHFDVIFAIAIGVGIGIILGAIPGLTATMGIAIVIPFTFYMNPVLSIGMLIGAYKGGMYGGSISAILIGTPGHDSAVATIMDGFAMTKKGQAGKALKMALYASLFGDMTSTLALVFLAPPLALLTLKIGPGDFFALIIFSLTIIASMSGESVVKGLISAAFGLLVATIGLDPVFGVRRLTFGFTPLDSGIEIMPLLIGLFALPEIIEQLEYPLSRTTASVVEPKHPDDSRVTWEDFKQSIRSLLVGSGIGIAIGAIPGIGSSVSCWLAYTTARNQSKHPEKWGTGIVEGVAAPESGNNAVVGGALIPMFTLGVPGSVPVAILMSAFLIQGIMPGPMIFQEAAATVYGVFASLFISNILLFVIGILIIRYMALYFTKVPKVTLFPIIISFCYIGAYALYQNMLDIKVALVFGILGYLMRKYKFGAAPFMIALILEPFCERSLRQFMLVTRGDFLSIFTHPIAVVFFVLTIVTVVVAIRQRMRGTAMTQTI